MVQGLDDHAPADTRLAILEAASELFEQRGYAGVRVHDVARRAGLTTGAIYAHFDGKADLLLEVVATLGARELASAGLDRDSSAHGGARRGRPPTAADILHALASRLPGHRRSRPVALEALAAAGRDESVRRRVGGELGQSMAVFRSLVERGQADGDIDADVDPAAAATFGLALSLGFVALDSLDLPTPTPAAWKRLVARMIGALAPGGRP